MFRSTWIRTRFFRPNATEVPLKKTAFLKGINFGFSLPVLLMDDRPNRRCPVTCQLFVLQKGELHSAPTKKMSRLERVRKSKAAS